MNYFSELFSILILCLLIFGSQAQQKVAPGVPPQHYQPNPQQVQYQQQQQHQQQQHYQQQPQVQYQQHHPQVNPEVYQHQQMVDPIYQQVPQGQVPVQHYEQVPQQQQQHHQQHQQPHAHQQQQPHSHQQNVPHAAGGHQQQVLNAANIQHEKEHIAEHLEVPIDTSKMTDQELQFHYFKMHDADHNNKLDGCELIKSLIHWHAQGSKHGDHQTNAPNVEEKIFSDEELTALIDPILQSDDISKDGYIDYPEFIRAQQKTAAGR